MVPREAKKTGFLLFVTIMAATLMVMNPCNAENSGMASGSVTVSGGHPVDAQHEAESEHIQVPLEDVKDVREPDATSRGGEVTEESNNDYDGVLSSWFGSSFINLIVNKTQQISEMLQWGEAEPEYSLSKEADEINRLMEHLKLSSDKAGGSSKEAGDEYTPSAEVADRTMYERLGVESNASKATIKKAYYKLALKYHPDKNPNDEEAKRKFQEIGEAYQILYDDDLRQKYDRQGIDGTAEMTKIDPSLFFMLLFGTDSLVDYIGKLRLASILNSDNAAVRPKQMSKQMELEQILREVQLARKLAVRLDREVTSSAISVQLMDEVNALCTGAFSDALVDSIGWVYENCGNQFLAEATTLWGLGAAVPNLQATGRSVSNAWGLVKSIVNMVMLLRDMEEGKTQDPGIEHLKTIIQNMLSMVLFDVENTVRAAATKCCKDSDVPPERRLARARALVTLGRYMQQTVRQYRVIDGESPDFTQKLQDAYVRMTARREEAHA
ncbi:DnaJ domain-containing protein [Babesia caballi]|uniref:DnaJ domain-containing protein n=1 Tax=Babesia caballi TaxID=5871 RepID=A0AAV4LU23_BABCB|nr:DnaJ domain-containing protein [Babesia caballi]